MKKLIKYQLFESSIDQQRTLDYLKQKYTAYHMRLQSLTKEQISDYIKHFLKLNLNSVQQLYAYYSKITRDDQIKRWGERYANNSRGYSSHLNIDEVIVLTELALANKRDIFEWIVETDLSYINYDKLFKSLARHLPQTKPYIDFVINQGHKPAALAMKKIYGVFDWTTTDMYKQLTDPLQWAFNDVTTDRMRKNGSLRLQDTIIKDVSNKYQIYTFSVDGRLRRLDGDLLQLIAQTKISIVDEESANMVFNAFLDYYYKVSIRNNNNVLSGYLKKDLLRRKPKRAASWQQIEEFWKHVLQQQPDIINYISTLPLRVYSIEIRHLLQIKFINNVRDLYEEEDLN